jgi:hypothetical protein
MLNEREASRLQNSKFLVRHSIFTFVMLNEREASGLQRLSQRRQGLDIPSAHAHSSVRYLFLLAPSSGLGKI